ncbi:MAG: hypothetical protein QGI78_00260 [Phycisphaerales bacterium]|nr:hypothetical protein [Phycisphaerales bacterium]
MGDIAMINGRVFGIGDVLSPPSIATPLVLEKVHRRSVIIFAGDRRYELTIAPPRR